MGYVFSYDLFHDLVVSLTPLKGMAHTDPECKGGGKDVITYEKKTRRLQLLKKCNCTATSTWTNNDDNRELHTWRAWGSRVCKKQPVFWGQRIYALRRGTCTKVRLRTWDHVPVIVKIEEKDLRTKEGSERLGGLDPWIRSREKASSKNLCSGDRTETRKDEHDGKATTTALRNRNKFTVPDEIREMAAEAKIMNGAVHSVYVFCVPLSAYALQLLLAFVQITHCVDYGVLASLDGTTQCLKLVVGEQQRVPQASVSSLSLSHALVPVPSGQPDLPFAKSRGFGMASCHQ